MLTLGRFSLLLVAVVTLVGCSPSFEKYRSGAAAWEQEVQQLEALDKTEKYTDKAILFLGSSSIRGWRSMATDLAPFEGIRRGYGGAKFSDLYFFARRLVKNHRPQAVAIFIANDVSGTNQDKTPAEVLVLAKGMVSEIRKELPRSTPIYFIEITPTPSRWQVWQQIQEVNRLIKNYTERTHNLRFIETSSAFLDANGQPRPELFIGDKLHLKPEGYALWANVLKKRFAQDLK